jgi:hypothetical protein
MEEATELPKRLGLIRRKCIPHVRVKGKAYGRNAALRRAKSCNKLMS